MTPVYIDFESYWSTTHTLTRMSPTEYITHPDTEIISVAIRIGDEPTYVLFGEQVIREHLQDMDWGDKIVIGHNMSGFDSMILAWRLNIKPKMYGCTAAMARSKYSKTGTSVNGKFLTGVSLKKLAAELKVGAKLDLEATNTKGKHLCDFSEYELAEMAEYNKVDTDLCAELFKKLAKGFPKAELMHIDMTTRMLVEPKFQLDYDMVNKALEDVKAEKAKSLNDLYNLLFTQAESVARKLEGDPTDAEEYVRMTMASSAKFGELLKQRGVDVPMKQSPTNPAKMTPALAKTDDAFIALQDHEDPIIAAAARVRLEVKSTLLETRLQAFVKAADACDGRIPVPLKYAGADTTGRWSGEQYNMQNLPRINPKVPKPSDALRNSLRAPKKHKIVVADLSGIELRVNHFLWKVKQSMDLYASDAKADLYRSFAAARYGIDESDVSKDQRQLAKIAQLGLGFGAGAPTFRKVAKLMGGLDLSEGESLEVVTAWRDTYHDIVKGWRAFQNNIPNIQQGIETAIDPWGLCVAEKHAVRLPSGRKIYYPGLTKESDNGKTEWWYGAGRSRARIYAGKGVENLVQAIARDVIAEHGLTMFKRTGFRPSLAVHDELVYIVPETVANEVLDELQSIMRKGVSWWPELITWSEGDVGDTYGEVK
jgi:DNA polymerase I-like protein with 3'-5' exonuclease and polymerase domains